MCATKDGDGDGIELNSNRQRLVWTSVDFHPAHHRRRPSYSIVISRKCYTKWTQIIEIASLTPFTLCAMFVVVGPLVQTEISIFLYIISLSIPPFIHVKITFTSLFISLYFKTANVSLCFRFSSRSSRAFWFFLCSCPGRLRMPHRSGAKPTVEHQVKGWTHRRALV